jgi:hypothetical protein
MKKRVLLGLGTIFAAALALVFVPGALRAANQQQPPCGSAAGGQTTAPCEYAEGGATTSGGAQIAFSAHCRSYDKCTSSTSPAVSGYVVLQIRSLRAQGPVTCLDIDGTTAEFEWRVGSGSSVAYDKAKVTDLGDPVGGTPPDQFEQEGTGNGSDCDASQSGMASGTLQSGNFVVSDPALLPCIALSGDGWAIDSNCNLSTSF